MTPLPMRTLRYSLAAVSVIASIALPGPAFASQGKTSHAPYRGQARISVLYFGDLTASPSICRQGKPGHTPALVEAQIDVRYAKGNAWHQRGNVKVSIQKRSPSGTWITVAHAYTDENDSAVPGWGHADRQFHSNVNTPAKRWFRAYVPATATYQAVVTPAVDASVFCGED
jgi:hypothetical protein